MDLSKDVVLKENYTFLVADAAGQVTGGEHGLYDRDTRFLNRYSWSLGEAVQALVMHTPRPDILEAHYALIEGPSQVLGIRRLLKLEAGRMTDTLSVENSSLEPGTLTLELALGSDFVDMFEARGWEGLERPPINLESTGKAYRLCYRAEDGLEVATLLEPSQAPDAVKDGVLTFGFTLAPKETRTLTLTTTLQSVDKDHPGPAYDDWLSGFKLPEQTLSQRHQEVLTQAQQDLRALLLFTEHGPVPAAGIPWFVAPFGRDSLLTAIMMLPSHPEVAEGTLRYLAAYQGQGGDTAQATQTEVPEKMHYDTRAEAPGKIMHELRRGELSRTGRVPFGPYYGTVDATALFVMVLRELWQHTGQSPILTELKPNWEAALAWMKRDGDLDGDGFLEFKGAEAGRGLVVQSWKDSWDSMSHADGTLATGALAVSEVQGYAYAAYLAAADFYTELGQSAEAARWRSEAETLKAKFHEAFWLPELQTYAMALDGDKNPLKVHNSNAGQLLWTGIVPDDVAPKLAHTLFSEANWSGWGIRTLGADEVRYNPVSYHNGSVWPHDTALIAGGLARYGFGDEAARIREATFDLASSQPDHRLPELVAGYRRSVSERPGGASAPPVPYPVACRPQAWDAAALLYLLTL